MNPANASISIAPTGTGTLTINPATAGTINNMAIGGTTPAAGAFTTLSATTAIAVTSGGTGQTSYTDGQLLIGNSTGNTLTKATLTAGTNITITNAAGAITIAASGGGGSGDVVGPASSTDNALARFDTTTGKLLQNSVGILSDTGAISGLTDISASGSVTLSGGTANGVTYLNGSKVLTSGSALVFDGTNLGVAVASPAYKLDVFNSGGYIAHFSSNTTSVGIQGDTVLFGNANLSAYGTGNYDASAHVFKISNTEGMRLNSTGLGIGTSSPAYKLSVNGNAGFTGNYISFNDYSYIRTDVAGWFTMQAGSNGYQWRDSANGATAQMVLNSSGNLGLGVTPSAWRSNYKAIQFSSSSAVYGETGNTYVGSNVFVNSSDSNTYITTNFASMYRQVDGKHLWYTAASGTAGNAITFTQAMTLSAAGNLAIGTTNTTARMNISVAYSSDTATSLGDVSKSHLHLGYPGFNNQYCQITFGYDATNAAAAIGYVGTSASGSTNGALVFATRDVTTSTLPTERARIDSSGRLLVNTTSQLAPGNQNGFANILNSADDGNWALALQNNATTAGRGRGLGVRFATDFNTTSSEFLYCVGNTNTRFLVNSNGGISNYSANNVNLSDRREKTNFAPATSYLDKICAIPVQTFNYIDQNMEDDGGLTLGVVAQDVQAVAPELVLESNWAGKDEEPKMRLSIYQTDLQYALMKCIQEQQALIQSLKARLDAANL
jgi:hypothetical protein